VSLTTSAIAGDIPESPFETELQITALTVSNNWLILISIIFCTVTLFLTDRGTYF
jgi:hypothetical protein